MRNRMTITKDELLRIQQENFDEMCIIDCDKEK